MFVCECVFQNESMLIFYDYKSNTYKKLVKKKIKISSNAILNSTNSVCFC